MGEKAIRKLYQKWESMGSNFKLKRLEERYDELRDIHQNRRVSSLFLSINPT